MTKPNFKIQLLGPHTSRVFMDGRELAGVKDIKCHQPAEGPPTITIEFIASSIRGIGHDE